MTRFLDKYIIYYADKWETTHRLKFALTGLFLFGFQWLYSLWAIVMIPVVIWLSVTLHQQNKQLKIQTNYEQVQGEFVAEQQKRIEELRAVQILAVKYGVAVDAYYNEILKARGFKGTKLKSKKVGKNSFELVATPLD